MNFATVTGVYADGVTLRFDDGQESQKHYKVIKGAAYAVGDRVKITPVSGTFVVEYAVGNPTV